MTEGLRIERATVEERFLHRAHVNERTITVTQKLREHTDVALSDAALDD